MCRPSSLVSSDRYRVSGQLLITLHKIRRLRRSFTRGAFRKGCNSRILTSGKRLVTRPPSNTFHLRIEISVANKLSARTT